MKLWTKSGFPNWPTTIVFIPQLKSNTRKKSQKIVKLSIVPISILFLKNTSSRWKLWWDRLRRGSKRLMRKYQELKIEREWVSMNNFSQGMPFNLKKQMKTLQNLHRRWRNLPRWVHRSRYRRSIEVRSGLSSWTFLVGR